MKLLDLRRAPAAVMSGSSPIVNICFCAIAVLVICLIGCKEQTADNSQKLPRPVSVIEISESSPPDTSRATGVAGAWKVEDVGFEVGGRVKSVIEPDQDIEGRIVDENNLPIKNDDGEPISAGTELARLNNERFQLAVNSAEAQVQIAKRQLEAKKIEVKQTMKAQIDSAQADLNLAESTFKRYEQLAKQNATSASEMDQTRAERDKAVANLAQMKASLAVKEAELVLRAEEESQANEMLKDAKQDLGDCILVSSFRGQVAKVHVVRGSIVQRGDPVATVQMMDPIKIEVELSAAKSRNVNYRDMLPVYISSDNGEVSKTPLPGFVYMTDTNADPQTRTFTLTLLVRNEKLRQPVPDQLIGEKFARTSDIWPVSFDFLPGVTKDQLVVEEKAVQKDDSGFFVWKILNRKKGEPITAENRVLQVARVGIELGKQRLPFIGTMMFRHFTVIDENAINPDIDLIAGELMFDSAVESDSFQGPFVLMDREYWMVRPGDLVQVDLSGKQAASGIFVPVESIVEKAGRKYVYAVSGNKGDASEVRQLDVETIDDEIGQSIQIQSDGSLEPGTKIIVGGVHFISDGETVLINEVLKR